MFPASKLQNSAKSNFMSPQDKASEYVLQNYAGPSDFLAEFRCQEIHYKVSAFWVRITGNKLLDFRSLFEKLSRKFS